MREHRVGTFRVMLRRMDAGAAWRAQHHGAGETSARAMTQAACMIEYLVDDGIREAGKLNLGNRLETFRCHADAHAGNQIFSERRIDDALGTELVEQAERRAKDATIAADVLP